MAWIKKNIWWLLLGVFVIMQLIPYNVKNDTTNPKNDFFAMNKASQEVQTLVKAACYDCHSHQVKNPWYGRIAPIKFIVNRHVRGGRMNVDFSNWHQYDAATAKHKLKECADEINSHEMPLSSYLLLHPEAELSEAQRKLLADFFMNLANK